MHIQKLHQIHLLHNGICTDTRKVKKGNLFFALKGNNFNANQFAEHALQKGCSYAIIDEANFQKDERYIVVENVLKTLQELASYHRKQLNCPVIGITGTNGKTTTKELITAVLRKGLKTHSTQGNLNNHIGVPLTLLSTPLNAEMLIVEMGANHPKEIASLSDIAQPSYGIITNIGKAHLEGFGGYQGVIETKKELYDYLLKNENTVFVNQNDQLLMELSEEQNRILYGEEAKSYLANPFATITFKGERVQSRLVGSYNCSNISAACAIGDFFKISITEIKEAIANYTPTNNRSQIKKTAQGNILILDAYNANPSSVTVAIESFNKMIGESKVVILGDMLELGEDAITEHQNIIQQLEKGDYNKVLLVGEYFSKCKHSFRAFENTESLARWLENQPLKNRNILLKGSRGIQLESLETIL